MSLTTPEKVRKLQETLHAKAKGSPGYRFCALYDKVYCRDVLEFAFDCCRSYGGAPGIDGQTFADIEEYGTEKWLGELADDLRKKTYQPQPVRRVFLPINLQVDRFRSIDFPIGIIFPENALKTGTQQAEDQ